MTTDQGEDDGSSAPKCHGHQPSAIHLGLLLDTSMYQDRLARRYLKFVVAVAHGTKFDEYFCLLSFPFARSDTVP